MTLDRVLWWAAAAATAVLAVVLAVQAPDTLGAMQSNGDYVAPLVMGHDAHLYPDSRIVLGNYGWFAGMWAVQGLQRLPAADHLAAGLPLAITFALVALVALQALRRFGPGAALLVLALAL